MLLQAGIPTPRTFVTDSIETLRPVAREMPIVVKPYRGSRGQGIEVCLDEAQFDALVARRAERRNCPRTRAARTERRSASGWSLPRSTRSTSRMTTRRTPSAITSTRSSASSRQRRARRNWARPWATTRSWKTWCGAAASYSGSSFTGSIWSRLPRVFRHRGQLLPRIQRRAAGWREGLAVHSREDGPRMTGPFIFGGRGNTEPRSPHRRPDLAAPHPPPGRRGCGRVVKQTNGERDIGHEV